MDGLNSRLISTTHCVHEHSMGTFIHMQHAADNHIFNDKTDDEKSKIPEEL